MNYTILLYHAHTHTYTQTQVHDLKQAQSPSTAQLHSMLMDPAVNLMFLKMKSELKDVKEKLAQAQSDLSAWKFSTDRSVLTKLVENSKRHTSDHQCSVVLLILYYMLYCITSSHELSGDHMITCWDQKKLVDIFNVMLGFGIKS